MSEVKLTPEETVYYSRLFLEDKNYYTVVDSVRQLAMFEGRFTEDGDVLAFVEFISNIFHICWQKDVFDKNHLRLMDILFGLQYAIEFEQDKEAEDIVERLLASFAKHFYDKQEQIRERVFSAQKDLVGRYQQYIPDKGVIEEQTHFFLKLSKPYALQFSQELVQGTLPEWRVRDRKGIVIDPLTHEGKRYNAEERLRILRDHLAK